jgi:phenylacetate-CoA ligase
MQGGLMARSGDSRYWNEYLETMPREALDAYHLRRIRSLIKYAYETTPMYRKLYDQARVRPEDIRSLEDFVERVPTIDKPDLLAAQAVCPPHGDLLARAKEEAARQVFMTSGSTGVPLQVPYHEYQILRNAEHVASLCWAVGVRPGDSMYLAFNFGIFTAFWVAYVAAFRLGTYLISGGGVDTRTRIRQVLELKPTVLFSTPTYALHMAEVAREQGVDLASSTVRYVLVAGEPGGNIPSTRGAIEAAWGAKVYEFYGTSEAGALAQGCPVQGRMHVFEQEVFSLVLDEKGKPVANGQTGENVVTSYCQLTQPIIKFRTHDLVEVHYEPCECGRTWMYFQGGVLGRSDNMITVRGVNVFPAAVEALLAEVEGTSEHYELHVWREKGLDQLLVKVEAERQVAPSAYDAVAARAQELLHHRVRVRIPVEVLPPGSLPRYELKAKRFFDHRSKQDLA